MKYLNRKQRSEFVMALMSLELTHLDRIKEEVNWFTKKFDYRNQDAPWKTRGMQFQGVLKKFAVPVNLTGNAA